jgi:hypothetical protein
MKTSSQQVEERLAHLEREVEQLKGQLCEGRKGGWRAVVGSHQDSKMFDEVVRAIRRHRREDYAAARGASTRRKRVRRTKTAEK